jgi:hypothetical protein
MTEKRAVMKVTYDLLRQLVPPERWSDMDALRTYFALPPFVNVLRCAVADDDYGTSNVSLLLSGDGLPDECRAAEGGAYPIVTATYWQPAAGAPEFIGFTVYEQSRIRRTPAEVLAELQASLATEA